MSLTPTILVVDDERSIREVVEYALAREGFTVETATNGIEALARVARGGVDLVVLDILMPEMDGLSVCRRLRERERGHESGPIPIIFLSSRGEEVDRILGLDLGSDDYITKPFSPRELVSRVRAVLRRAKSTTSDGGGDATDGEPRLVHGRIEMDVARHEVRVAGARVDLTVTEFGVLRALIEHPGHVLTRSQLVDRAYRHDNVITERTIDTHVRRIRAKLRVHGVDPIETVHGLGYRARERV